MAYLLAKATVEDFDAWKSSFDDNDSIRTEGGQRGYQAFRSVDDPNEVVVLFEWNDEDPRAFFQSEEMRERMTDAGVKGMPEMSTVSLVDRKSAVEPSA